ncbi:MAG: DUF3147 family protein [Bdellovibrionota bacterium]
MRFLLNTLISALIIASVAEIGKRSTFVGALLVALPLTSILALSFLYVETKDIEKVSALSYGIFWLVLPTLLFFILLPLLLKSGLSFWAALASSMSALLVVFFGYAWLLKRFGVEI